MHTHINIHTYDNMLDECVNLAKLLNLNVFENSKT